MFYINLNSENKVWHAYKGKQNKSAMLKSTPHAHPADPERRFVAVCFRM